MILQFARFDLMSWLPRKQTLIPLAFILVVGIVLPVPGMAIVAGAFVTSLMVSAPFLGDERGRLDTLYGVLPVSRRTVVAGRTLAIIAYHLIAAAVATAVTITMALWRGDEIVAEILLIAHAIGFAIVGLAMSLQLPVFFRIGYSRARLMVYAPAVVTAGLAWLSQATDVLDPIIEGAAAMPVALLAGIGVLLGVAGLAVGTTLSMRTFGTRELR